MPRKINSREKYQPTAFDKASTEFWKLPSKNVPASTPGKPSVRNLIGNVKRIPSSFVEVGKKIKDSMMNESKPTIIRAGQQYKRRGR
jgi:hypothetical protein